MSDVEVMARAGRIARLQEEGEGADESQVESYIAWLVPLDTMTDDGRLFEELTWREPPLPMMATDKTSFGHEGAVLVGKFEDFRIQEADGVDWVVATPVWDTDEEALDFRRMVDEEMLRGISADVAVIDADLEVVYDEDGFVEDMKLIVHQGKVLGATIVPMPAFEGTRVEPDIAAALEVPSAPPRVLFENPHLDRLTPLTVDGIHVFGHLAPWDECHVGITNVCTVAPRSGSDYALFAAGQLECDDGSTISVGQITLAGGHAPRGVNWKAATAHYDDTQSAVADVAVGEDEHGIWFSGCLRNGISDDQLRMLRASKLSGDWRTYQGRYELVAMLCVNSPGFPIARALVASGEQSGLILTGMVDEHPEGHLLDRLQKATEIIERHAWNTEAERLTAGL